MKKLLLSIVFSLCFILSGCGANYSGTYSGSSGNTTLILNNDKTCTYDEYAAFASMHWDGVYEVDGDKISFNFNYNDYEIKLSGEVKDDEGIYITSEMNGWSPEYFSKN